MNQSDLTSILNNWSGGNSEIEQELINKIYPQIYAIAQAQLRRNKDSMEATEVVNEAFIELKKRNRIEWKNREQFFAISAQIIRRFLIDDYRKQISEKRGAQYNCVTIDKISSHISGDTDIEFNLIEFDKLLTKLESIDQLAARIVKLKFFTGLTTNEVSELLEMSVPTINYNWKFARSWLLNQLS